LADDRDRLRRGNAARIAAHRIVNELDALQMGHAIVMDLYQLLRVRYEWGLTHDYQFPQHVPGYYRPAPSLRTPPTYPEIRGGVGSVPGYLNVNASGSSPWFEDWLPDPNLLHRDPQSRPAVQPSSHGSISTLNLPGAVHPQETGAGQSDFSGPENASRQRSSNRSHREGAELGRPLRRRASGGSSLGHVVSSPLPRTRRSIVVNHGREGAPSPEPFNAGAQTETGARRTLPDVQTTSAQRTGDVGVGNRPDTPTRMQYMQMTMQQLRDEITYRGGEPRQLRQRKEDLVQALLDYDAVGNYGNGVQERRRATAIPPHPTLSPRALRPRINGRVAGRR
jgi:hypothetical protein